MSGRRTYLDYNASAPLRQEARVAMVDALDHFGNASSVHAEGRKARALIDAAREEVATLVNARPSEVVFTSGATEANAWALAATTSAIALAGIEHESVRVAAQAAQARGITVVELPAGSDGSVDYVSGGLSPGDVLALQLANNETGILQPVAKAAAWAASLGLRLHTDAVQAPGRIAVDFQSLGAATMSLSAHKIGGPKGVGALVIRDAAPIVPLIGGAQELRRRGGTENVAAIAGFGAAARAALADLEDTERMTALRDTIEAEVLAATPEATIIGHDVPRLPNTSAIALPGMLAETLVIKLDLNGIAVSAGAACSSGKVGQSSVLAAMGVAPEAARSTIRVSIGVETTEEDIAAFIGAWRRIHQGTLIAA